MGRFKQVDCGFKGTEGNWITFLKEDKLPRDTSYHFLANELACVKVRPTGERQEWKVQKGCDLRMMMRSVVSIGITVFEVSGRRHISAVG